MSIFSFSKLFKLFKLKKQKKTKIMPRMYIVLREDLGYKYIQGQHALAQFVLEHYPEFQEWNNQYVYDLAVFNGLALRDLYQQVSMKAINIGTSPHSERYKISAFYEPDLESPLPTAICIFENGDGYAAEALKDVKLATK